MLLWLIERLAREGHEVLVFVPRQEPEPGRWNLLGATVHNAGQRPYRPRLLWRIADEHRRGPFDLVHALWAQGQGVLGAIAARLLGVPMVLSCRTAETWPIVARSATAACRRHAAG